MDLFTILIRHITIYLIRLIFAILFSDWVTSFLWNVFTIIIGNLVTLLIRFLNIFVFCDVLTLRLLEIVASSWIVNPFFVIAGAFPMLIAFSQLNIFAYIFGVRLLNGFVVLVATLFVFLLALPFIFSYAFLLLVIVADSLVLGVVFFSG